MKKEVVAMLLAGGQGSRLYALTSNVAKPAVPFGGKYRIIDFPLSNCVNSGIDSVGVLTQYQPLELNDYIGNGQPWDLNRNWGGAHVLPPYTQSKTESWYKGTANAIYQNIPFVDRYNPEYVVIHKPFYPHIVKRRSNNIIELYENKRDMEQRLKEQEEELIAKDKKIRENNEFMIETLSSVVEARSAETGEHTRRIKYFTRIMLKYLMKYFPKYGITQDQIDEISRASALHDIGKIGIADAILLKPGRLTPEEFEIMKTHTTIGCDILEKSYKDKSSDFYTYAYNICRHHHERWDGKGYPDKLVGDEIPIYTQVVAIADVYDALVSPRVYKSAYANSIAYEMIMNGECGQFSPDVLECFGLAKEDFVNIVEVIKMFDFS